MDESARNRVKQVLIMNCESNDCGKRNIAFTILADVDLFELFCRAVAVKEKAKINQKYC